MSISPELTLEEQAATVRALDRWEQATGSELYEPVISYDGAFRVLIGREEDANDSIGRHGWNRIIVYREPVQRFASHAGGYVAMFEAVVLHELGHQLGAGDIDTGGIMGVDHVPAADWRLCINVADLHLVCGHIACGYPVAEC